MGGAAESALAGKAQLIFEPGFLNTAELRNRALRKTTTRLAACLDTNVFARAGWLTTLIQCQRDTGASMVVPLALEGDDRVHTARRPIAASPPGGPATTGSERGAGRRGIRGRCRRRRASGARRAERSRAAPR